MDEQARIAVIGSPGAGKSTLAIALAAATGLPLIHLDVEHWQPGWVEPDKAEWTGRCIAQAAGERWVIDGNYASSQEIRLVRATLVVWLDLPTRSCLAGTVRRSWRYRGGGRPDMAPGCPERLDREWLKFLWYIATFRRRLRPGIVTKLSRLSVPVVQLTTVADRARFKARLATDGLAGVQGMARLASSRIEMP